MNNRQYEEKSYHISYASFFYPTHILRTNTGRKIAIVLTRWASKKLSNINHVPGKK